MVCLGHLTGKKKKKKKNSQKLNNSITRNKSHALDLGGRGGSKKRGGEGIKRRVPRPD